MQSRCVSEMDQTRMTEFCKFPEEMALEILSRMQPKSLMRFKCVRKSWYALINCPNFLAKHLHNSIHNKQSICIFCKRFVIMDTDPKDVETVCSLIIFPVDNDGDHDHEHISYPVVQDLDLPRTMSGVPKNHENEPELLGAIYIVGHCDGIICLVHDEIVLWNPAIKQFKILPEPPLTYGVVDSIGFGYDAKSKDYKVFSVPDPTSEHDFNHPPQVEVYNLSTDSWTEIKTDHLETETTNLHPQFFQMYFKGIWYWTGSEQQKEFMDGLDQYEEDLVRQLIIVFDMNDEAFDSILLPYSLYDPLTPSFEMRVIAWNEYVAVFGQYRFGDTDEAFGLWVMDDLVKGFWTKQLTLEVIVGSQMILEFWKSDELLMVANDNRIFTYNFITEEIRYLPIGSTHPAFSKAIVCINSIVPVFHGRQEA